MWIFGDSFDLYAPSLSGADMYPTYWDSGNLNTSFPVGRFGGQCLPLSTFSTITKSSGANDSIHHIILAINPTTALGGATVGTYVEFFDGATAQCSIVFRADGSIILTNGGPTSTITATYLNALTLQNQWFAFEIEVVIHNTQGSMAIRKNGNTVNDFFAGSLNTRVSANNYANKIILGANSGVGHVVDDFLWRSDPSLVPWLGDVRCYVRRPATDVTVQFSRSGATTQTINSFTAIYNAFVANQAHYLKFTANYSGTINTVTWTTGANYTGTGNAKFALYADNGGIPGVLLGASNVVTNPSVGTQTITFPTGVPLTAGQTYWWGENQDNANLNASVTNIAGTGSLAVANIAYGSWPATNPSVGGAVSGVNQHAFMLTYTPTGNCQLVQDITQDGANTYVYDNVVGHNDLYNITAVNVANPVVAVTVRGCAQKSDAGSRSGAMQLKSGATTVQSINGSTILAGSWGWMWRTDLTDPNTGSAWATTAVDAVQIGPILTA